MLKLRSPSLLAFAACLLVCSLTAGDESPAPDFVNSLGMRFVTVPGVAPRVSVWTTRVRDFSAFVAATKHDATQEVYSLKAGGGWELAGRSWQAPGFAQGEDHPVVGVSWDDAKAFCLWLTRMERASGRIGAGDEYRLPTDSEWSVCASIPENSTGSPGEKGQLPSLRYAWGAAWPPSPGSGNFAGEETTGVFPAANIIAGYRDGWVYTSPVGTFAPNQYGLFDLGGNVWQWCEDWYDSAHTYRVMRGGSFYYGTPKVLDLSKRDGNEPNGRGVLIGFRIVLARGN